MELMDIPAARRQFSSNEEIKSITVIKSKANVP